MTATNDKTPRRKGYSYDRNFIKRTITEDDAKAVIKAKVTLEQAQANGDKIYAGRVCKNCNDSLRYTLDNSCVSCRRKSRIKHTRKQTETEAKKRGINPALRRKIDAIEKEDDYWGE